jgi:hypothetical protein
MKQGTVETTTAAPACKAPKRVESAAQGPFTAPANRLSDGRAIPYGAYGRRDRRSPLGKVADMPTEHPTEATGSPVPGVFPAPVRVQHDAAIADQRPASSDPNGEREARRQAREDRRGPTAERPGVMIPNRRKRLPLEAPLMRVVATAGIVGIAVVIAAIMGSQGSQGWLIGLAASIVSLVLAAVLWSSRRL